MAGRVWFLRRPEESVAVAGSAFDPALIVRPLRSAEGAAGSLRLWKTLQWIEGYRAALLSVVEGESEAVRRLVSGHEPDGRALEEPHVALFPVPFVGEPGANGSIVAFAVAVPRGVSREVRAAVLRVVERVEQLSLGRGGRWRLGPTVSTSSPGLWDRSQWTAEPCGARHWATVTPVAFDRHPRTRRGQGKEEDIASLLRASCRRAGLPEPTEVMVTSASPHAGVPPAHAFPPLGRKDGSIRQHVHAILVFGEPVCGPILIGAGRYRGYGLFRRLGPQ